MPKYTVWASIDIDVAEVEAANEDEAENKVHEMLENVFKPTSISLDSFSHCEVEEDED